MPKLKRSLSGKELRAARQELGLTVTEIAASLGVSARTIDRWESSEKPIPETASRLFKILNDLEGRR
jgi:DNA-binding transcriptional regulator YiaG